MRLRKIELKLESDQYWPKLSIVHVDGDSTAQPIPESASQPEAEKVIRSWDRVAVLKVTPADGKALIGFWSSPEHCQYLNMPVETTEGGLFAMRIGDGPVDFFIVPQDHKTNYNLELVEVANINDSKYGEVAVY